MNPIHSILVWSVLENGHHVLGFFAIGSMFHTQWGFRRVVSHVSEAVRLPSEPVNV